MKQFIKKIPIIGWLSRWTYNLLRLNNIKHRVYRQQQQLEAQQEQILVQQQQLEAQQEQILVQQQQLEAQQEQILVQQKQLDTFKNEFYNKIDSKIAKEIYYHSVSFQQRIDQFIFDSKIDIKNAKI